MTKKILKTAVFSFMILSLLSVVIAKEKQFTSNWTTVPLKIDGMSADWGDDTLNHEKKVKVDFAFRNNSDYFYILFVFTDQKFLTSINQTGMTLYFNSEGKKKKDYGIRFYQKRISPDGYIAMLEKQSGPISEAEKTKIQANRVYNFYAAVVVNKKGESLGSPETPPAKLASFRVKSTQSSVALEFAVPMERAAELIPGVGSAPGKIVKLGFEWGGMTKAVRDARLKGVSARGTQGRAGNATSSARGTRGSGSGVSANLSSIRGRSPKKYTFWVDVKLVEEQ